MLANSLSLSAESGSVRISQSIGDSVCDRQPRAQGVDGRSINGLSQPARISALQGGTVYAEEVMSQMWPYCSIVIRETRLDGFSAAYSRFVQIARERGVL